VYQENYIKTKCHCISLASAKTESLLTGDQSLILKQCFV